ncbi:hypothetical protein DFR52_103782 [Hoeflea marina]|uniref:Uncharacterized protein n=1 Tax=Hoeflea marina TaxID=274592 RepID=A0A317PLU1_9HYPH|nr:hypothetical protein [Hoeflea marina]PWW00575.1 hypothetical protein DFR52_103782 [Hoeflea marina]
MEDDQRVRAAKRDLERLAGEGRLSASPVLKSRVDSVKGHFAATDADQADAVEVWGTRIARGLAVVAFVVLAGWLYLTYLR